MKEQIKAPEKIQLSNKEVANLSYTQFKTLVIRMLTEMVEYGHKIEEKVKAVKSEIKQNVQRTNSEGKETYSNQWFGPEEDRNIQLVQNEGTRIQKNEERLRNLQNNFKHSNIQIIRVSEGEEEEQEIEHLLEKIKKNMHGPNSEGRKPGHKSTIWSRKKT